MNSKTVRAKHAELLFLADSEDIVGTVNAAVGQLGDMHQAFDARRELRKRAEIGDA